MATQKITGLNRLYPDSILSLFKLLQMKLKPVYQDQIAKIDREKRNRAMESRHRNDEKPAQNDAFSICPKCISMTSGTQNAKTLNSKQGFKHSSPRELALSSRN
jgi:hypothetical protein